MKYKPHSGGFIGSPRLRFWGVGLLAKPPRNRRRFHVRTDQSFTFGGTPAFVSPQTDSHQGYATDVQFHFTIDTTAIHKRRDDAVRSAVQVNPQPFVGLPALNHLGEGDYHRGAVCSGRAIVGLSFVREQTVLVFSSAGLARVATINISAVRVEAAALAIDGFAQEAYLASYCDGTKILRLNLADFSQSGEGVLKARVHRHPRVGVQKRIPVRRQRRKPANVFDRHAFR